MHGLQCDRSLGWDTTISSDHIREWKNIARQINSSQEISLPRFVGRREGKFRLVVCSDSSKLAYGVVVYIQDLESSKVSFLMAKNRIVNKSLESKSIPSLEFQGLVLAVETSVDLLEELSGPMNLSPIDIKETVVYCDSMVSLHWLHSYSEKLDKMNKQSVFILNRLKKVVELCDKFPITFKYVAGLDNPADLITRPVSYNTLIKSNYYDGPKVLHNQSSIIEVDHFEFVVPKKSGLPEDIVRNCYSGSVLTNSDEEKVECLERLSIDLDLTRFSSLDKVYAVLGVVKSFISKLKDKLRHKRSTKSCPILENENKFRLLKIVILDEQKKFYPEIFEYFNKNKPRLKDIPELVSRLNIFPDEFGLLRVKSKFARKNSTLDFPILLHKSSLLSKLIILNIHSKLSHAGCYSVLSEMRKQFWIVQGFSAVKKVVRECIHCKKFNAKPLNVNQSSYRDFRMNPSQIPFNYCYLDYLGPFQVHSGENKVKVWLLIVTCMWTRAINLKVCYDLSLHYFLRAFQLHTFDYGVPSYCISDMGSQIVAGANVIQSFLADEEVRSYFESHNIKTLKFEQINLSR